MSDTSTSERLAHALEHIVRFADEIEESTGSGFIVPRCRFIKAEVKIVREMLAARSLTIQAPPRSSDDVKFSVPRELWVRLVEAVAPFGLMAEVYADNAETVLNWALIDAVDAKKWQEHLRAEPTPPQRLTDVQPHPETLEHEGRMFERVEWGEGDDGWLIRGLNGSLRWYPINTGDKRSEDQYTLAAKDFGAALYRPVPEPQEPAAPAVIETEVYGIVHNHSDVIGETSSIRILGHLPFGKRWKVTLEEIQPDAALSDDKAVG